MGANLRGGTTSDDDGRLLEYLHDGEAEKRKEEERERGGSGGGRGSGGGGEGVENAESSVDPSKLRDQLKKRFDWREVRRDSDSFVKSVCITAVFCYLS